MARELLIELYLFGFRVLFTLCKVFPLQDKLTFIDTFGDNCEFVYDELRQRDDHKKVVFLRKARRRLRVPAGAKVIGFETGNPLDMVRSIYHIATSRFIVIDNYYGFLAAVRFKPGVECIQLWHAAGALKKFGLCDQSVAERSARARRRFLRVYRQFHKVVVGSDALAELFTQAFGLSPDRVLRTGVPRTDLFYDKERQAEILARLRADNPALVGKKVILYAPTFRDHELNNFRLHLDLDRLERELGQDHVLILRLHPAIRGRLQDLSAYRGFVFDYSDYPNVNELLLLADYLITDYSSIPYEYALLGRPMIFYPYDLSTYQEERGLWADYESMVPGPVVFSTAEIVRVIREGAFDLARVQQFAATWNQYSQGQSSRNLVQYLLNGEEYRVSREIGRETTVGVRESL
jgi:CDP-glycerol glycerophosphotransferase (TagB/SpsB family)